MKNSLPIIAFFSVIFFAAALLSGGADAQSIAISPNGTVKIQPAPQAPTAMQPLPQASITLISPVGGETFVAGNRYDIKWHANIPQVNQPYHLMGEIRLLDQNPATKKDLRIAKLDEQGLAKGTYQFLAGAQTDLTYNHTASAQGTYKVWIFITGYTDCATAGKCAPLFEATATSNGAITLK